MNTEENSTAMILARLILTLGARYKGALWLKMFLFIYIKMICQKKKFFFLQQQVDQRPSFLPCKPTRGIFLKTDKFDFEAFKIIQALWGHHD